MFGPTSMAISDATTLADLFKANDVDEGVMRELADAPFKISTVKQLANTFDSKADIKSSWASKSQAYKHEGNQISNLIQAWRLAEEWTERGNKRVSDGLPEEDLDEPLRDAVQLSLHAAFKKEYSILTPATWTCVPGLVGRHHRELLKRIHTPLKIGRVKTLGVISEANRPPKRQKLCSDVELVFGGSSSDFQGVYSTFQYIHKLQALLYTLAFAGTYKVTYKIKGAVPETTREVLQVPLQLCLNHLADAQNFVMTHAGVCQDQVILHRLIKIDESIRNRWAALFKPDDDTPLGVIMEETATSYAPNLWAGDVPRIQKEVS